MVDRSNCIGGGPADAVYRDLSNGRARSDDGGLRHWELERVGAVPAIWDLPRYVLRLAWATGERGDRLVHGSLACAAALSARNRRGVEGRDHRDATALSIYGAAQAVGEARASGARDQLACGFDDWRDPQAGRPDRTDEAPAPADRPAATVCGGDGGQRRVVHRLQGLVPHRRSAADRSADDNG